MEEIARFLNINNVIEQSKSNDIHIDFTEDVLSLKDYDGRDHIINTKINCMDNLITDNIHFIINPSEIKAVNLANNVDEKVPLSQDHDLHHGY